MRAWAKALASSPLSDSRIQPKSFDQLHGDHTRLFVPRDGWHACRVEINDNGIRNCLLTDGVLAEHGGKVVRAILVLRINEGIRLEADGEQCFSMRSKVRGRPSFPCPSFGSRKSRS